MDGAFPSEKGQSFDSGFGRGRGPGRGFRGTAENAKTKICNRWLQGECRFGDRCNFAHGENELRMSADREDMQDMGRSYPPRGGRGGYDNRGGYNRGYNEQAMYAGGGGYGVNQGYNAGDVMNKGVDMYGQVSDSVPGPNGWSMYLDKNSGNPYYHNVHNKMTTWERPKDWPEDH